jgi:hypothetical protein
VSIPNRVCAYVNGYLFWPRSVSVTSQPGSLLTFSVDVTPVPEWMNLPERSHVVVFFEDPVTRTWRMLCEGEYIGWGRAKSATGARSRQLLCRGLFGYLETASAITVQTAVVTGDKSVQSLQQVIASGTLVQSPANSTVSDTSLLPLSALVDKAASGQHISEILLRIVHSITAQLPVEAFYYATRLNGLKLFSSYDAPIAKVIDWQRFIQAKNSLFAPGINQNMKVVAILHWLESLSFYTHVPILAPPLYPQKDTPPVIPEIMMIPHLYDVVPPACNVVFNDQIQSSSGTLDFMSQPTRVITQLKLDDNAIPSMMMCNDVYRARSVNDQGAVKVASVGQLMTHGFFSVEEMRRGVQPAFIPLAVEKLGLSPGSTNPQDQLFISASRHHYSVARGESTVRQFSCSFLPYLVAGFPCVVEDGTDPVHGMVASVTHHFPATGAPSTDLVITHVREAYALDTRSRSSPLPVWLNDIFTPPKICDTYRRLLGGNTWDDNRRGAACLQKDLTAAIFDQISTKEFNDTQVDVDLVLGTVLPIPKFNAATGESLGYVVPPTGTVAGTCRSREDPPTQFLKFQYRDGVPLSEYMRMHKLTTVSDNVPSDDGTLDPPTRIKAEGNEPAALYGYPFDMSVRSHPAETGPSDSDGKTYFGIFDLIPVNGKYISGERETVAAAIQAAIDRGVTADTASGVQ